MITKNYSIEEAQKGILLVFPQVPASLPNKDLYIIDFKVSSVLPTLSPPTITFTPSSPSYVINKNKNFSPTVSLSIKSNHNFETQSLIQASVKDQYNNTLYIDYILVICSPVSSVKFNGSLLSSNISDGIGPNGGSVLRLSDPNAFNSLFIGMTVSGPGIPSNQTISIVSFISNKPEDIELSTNLNVGSVNYSGNYTFTRSFACANTEQLINKQNKAYIILNKENNWSYYFNGKMIAKFVRENKDDDTIEIFIPAKNIQAIIVEDTSSNIPSVSNIYGTGRVSNNLICLVDI